ncbi:hypothetical protein CEXT_583441 [Caerostris extrusa]|uniref:Uncharacterized protein n=1 Tax=Caerostris extrusa TaxID=172846 RepID=A0AAV4XZ44_CAEEX|nr:hypothetical protein CEXT_583441 [Caerostris extrusa]
MDRFSCQRPFRLLRYQPSLPTSRGNSLLVYFIHIKRKWTNCFIVKIELADGIIDLFTEPERYTEVKIGCYVASRAFVSKVVMSKGVG